MLSKRKGSSYERLICKKLSLWLSAGKREDLLWRSSSSGATFTIHKKKGQKSFVSQSGDIAAIDKDAEPFMNLFSVELKHYNDLQFSNLLMNKNSLIETFWLKHKALCKSINKVPLMIVRQNRGVDLLVAPTWFDRQFSTLDSVIVKRLNCLLVPLDYLIKEIPANQFINLVGNLPKTYGD